MCISQYLIRYATHRQRCYELNGRFDASKAAAVTRIKRVAAFYRGKEEGPWIRQIVKDMLLLLPSEQSRYTRQRENILNLILKHDGIHNGTYGDGSAVVTADQD